MGLQVGKQQVTAVSIEFGVVGDLVTVVVGVAYQNTPCAVKAFDIAVAVADAEGNEDAEVVVTEDKKDKKAKRGFFGRK